MAVEEGHPLCSDCDWRRRRLDLPIARTTDVLVSKGRWSIFIYITITTTTVNKDMVSAMKSGLLRYTTLPA